MPLLLFVAFVIRSFESGTIVHVSEVGLVDSVGLLYALGLLSNSVLYTSCWYRPFGSLGGFTRPWMSGMDGTFGFVLFVLTNWIRVVFGLTDGLSEGTSWVGCAAGEDWDAGWGAIKTDCLRHCQIPAYLLQLETVRIRLREYCLSWRWIWRRQRGCLRTLHPPSLSGSLEFGLWKSIDYFGH